MDQAEELRRRIQAKDTEAPLIIGCLRAKGGIGATSLLMNLATMIVKTGKQLLFVDVGRKFLVPPMVGMAPVNVRLDNLEEASGESFDPGPHGFPLAWLENPDHLENTELLKSLKARFDMIIVDLPAFPYLNDSLYPFVARLPFLLFTPQPGCVFETYGMLKRLAESLPQGPLRVVINHAFSEADGKEAYVRFKDLIESRLGVSLKLAGVLPVEKEMLLLERSGGIFAIERPNHPFVGLLKQLAEELDLLRPDHKQVTAQG